MAGSPYLEKMTNDLKIYGETSDRWVVSEPITMTALGLSAYVLEKGDDRFYLERRKNNKWMCAKSFDTGMTPPNQTRLTDILTIVPKDPKFTNSVTDALRYLGFSKEIHDEISKIIFK